jgi:DNA-directed RNA polymerase subunit RPC12/RpoP
VRDPIGHIDKIEETPEGITASGGISLPSGWQSDAYAFDFGRPLRDAFASICFHNLPAEDPAEGLAYICSRCQRHFVARFRRPKRTGGYSCGECGSYVKKGPKQPRRWLWVEEPQPTTYLDGAGGMGRPIRFVTPPPIADEQPVTDAILNVTEAETQPGRWFGTDDEVVVRRTYDRASGIISLVLGRIVGHPETIGGQEVLVKGHEYTRTVQCRIAADYPEVPPPVDVPDGMAGRAIARMEREIRPALRLDLYEELNGVHGYNCCGCSTYEQILDHAIRIVREELA